MHDPFCREKDDGKFPVGSRWFAPYHNGYEAVEIEGQTKRGLTVKYLGYKEEKSYDLPWADAARCMDFSPANFKQLLQERKAPSDRRVQARIRYQLKKVCVQIFLSA